MILHIVVLIQHTSSLEPVLITFFHLTDKLANMFHLVSRPSGMFTHLPLWVLWNLSRELHKWQKWSGRKGINHMFSFSFPQQINNLKVLGWTKTRLCMFCFQMFLVYPSKMRWWKFLVSRETCLSWSRMINLPTHHRDVQRKHYHTWRDPMRCTKHCGHHWIFSSWPAHIYLSLELPS